MGLEQNVPVADRILQLLRRLGIAKAHFAAYLPRDWTGFVSQYPESVASLTLISPWTIKKETLRPKASRLMVITGDHGGAADQIQRRLDELPGTRLLRLADYFSPMWADIIADRTDEIGANMLDFLGRNAPVDGPDAVTLREGEGEEAGISYQIRGSGPPLVLFPLGLAPSQWEPLVPLLSTKYCTITLGGPRLGMVAFLEARSPGYLRVVQSVVNEMSIQSGQKLLEVGCGAGTVARWLARYTEARNPIVGVDVNGYLLREAANLAKMEALESIEWRNGNGEELPFADGEFDATMSFTVMEEGNADRMLAECARVTRPGGKVAVIVRSLDMPWWVNLPLRAELKLKAESRQGDVVEGGCADVSLYARMRRIGLEEVAMLPQWATFGEGERLRDQQERIAAMLNPDELAEWQTAVAAGRADGSAFISQPFHCAVGTKPAGRCRE